MPIEQYDERTIRCPRIGDFVPFKYCRTSGNPFCHVIVKCWAVKLDIGGFLAENYEPEVIHKGLERPSGGRLGKMLDVSAKARAESD